MPKTARLLIASMIYDIATDAVMDAGVTPEMFGDDTDRRVFERAVEFTQTYGRPPTKVVIANEFPKYRIDPVEDTPLDYLIDKLRKEYEQRLWYEGGDEMADALEAGDTERVRDVASRVVAVTSGLDQKAKTVRLNSSKLLEYLQLWQSRANAPGGLIGIPSGFEVIDAATLGFQPGQLVTVAGLGGAGKSTLMMLMAREAQLSGHPPFFLSFEMGEEEQVARYMAMAINVPYDRLVAGKITAEEYDRYQEEAAKADEQSIFALCTDIVRGSTVPKLEAEMKRQGLPAVAFIDGVYFMRDPETKMPGTDWQALTNITRGLKQLAQRLEIPIVISTQALPGKTTKGRRGSGARRLDMYSPGYSSSFAQDSDVMFGFEFDPDQPETRILRVTKARHCAPHTVRLEWNWETASFGDFIELLEGTRRYEEDEEDEDDV